MLSKILSELEAVEVLRQQSNEPFKCDLWDTRRLLAKFCQDWSTNEYFLILLVSLIGHETTKLQKSDT